MIVRVAWRAGLVAIVALAVTLLAAPAKAAWDPALRFHTIDTPHFRITYHDGLDEPAQRVANVAEGVYATMTRVMGWSPSEITEILLTDSAESANGSATALPYNAIRLLVTAPEDLSPLGDVDDWFLELVTHEFTHIVHLDNIRGIPAIANAILGKTFAPNQVQPRFILEGLGVYEESARTTAGRLHNSMWEMYMRTDVLENNVATLDQVANIVRRWPQGNLFYLYGSYFMGYIADTFGDDVPAKISSDYGKNIIPWGINRSLRRATGHTYEELYPAWIASLQRRYAVVEAAVRARGIREGRRLTHGGQDARYPRWIPKGSWAEHRGSLLYYRDDSDERTGLYAVDVERDARGAIQKIRKPDLVVRTSGESYASFLPDGGVVFSSEEFYKNVFLYDGLERTAPAARSTYGTPDGMRKRITPSGLRAQDPSTSPDGRRVAFVVNHAGTRTLHVADLEEDAIANDRVLVDAAPLEQAFTPRWAPDGKSIVYSAWSSGGYRDVRIVDVATGTFREITHDRAVDGDPVYSADGRTVYFHSDRTGIMNVYAWEVATGHLMQVTNVLSGAYSPEPSPDGKTLAYIGYTKDGFDLFAMPLDPATFLEPLPYQDQHATPKAIPRKRWPSRPYSVWPTIVPRRWGSRSPLAISGKRS